MCRRLFSTAMCWRRLISAGSVTKRKEPTWPLRARGSVGSGVVALRDLGHLADLFFERHLGEELVDEGAGFCVGGRGGDGLGDLVSGDGAAWQLRCKRPWR